MSQTPSLDNVPGADKGTAEGLAAPGRAGVGGTNNESQWLSIADFLARQNLRAVLQQKARSAAAPALAGGSGAAALKTLPVGNHGEIVAKEQGV